MDSESHLITFHYETIFFQTLGHRKQVTVWKVDNFGSIKVETATFEHVDE